MTDYRSQNALDAQAEQLWHEAEVERLRNPITEALPPALIAPLKVPA